MKYMHELKEKLCRELEDINRKPELSAGDLEAVHKLTDTVKNIEKINMLAEDGGYSRDDGWDRTFYDSGNSYARRKRDSMGRYSRDEYSQDRYSRDGGKEQMMEHLEQAMSAATSTQERDSIRRMIDNLRRD